MSTAEINRKLERAQLKLAPQPNQLHFSRFLKNPIASGGYTNYPGDGDEMEEIVETNLDIVENKIAIADEAVFIMKNNWDTIDESKRPIAEQNMQKLQDILENLRLLKDLYESLIVEPGVIIIEDGEREDPESFHIEIDPPTSLSPKQASELAANWLELLKKSEKLAAEELSLDLNL